MLDAPGANSSFIFELVLALVRAVGREIAPIISRQSRGYIVPKETRSEWPDTVGKGCRPHIPQRFQTRHY